MQGPGARPSAGMLPAVGNADRQPGNYFLPVLNTGC